MSTAQSVELALRKARLMGRIESQREQLTGYGAYLVKPFAAADKAVAVGRYVKERPWVAGVAVFAAVVLGRRNVLRWAGRGWTVWRGWRTAREWLQKSI